MIIVQLTGGLGNQLFQYAMGRALSERSKDTLMLDINSYSWDTLRKYELGAFNIIAHYATKEEIENIKQSNPLFKDRLINKLKRRPVPYFQLPYLKEQSFTFDLNYLKFKSKNVYVEGYWQSENYFSLIRSQLIKEIYVSADKFSTKFQDYRKLIHSSISSISIHVRRGDYVLNSETTAFHGLCDIDYYRNAMELMEQTISNPTYFVFSDDKEYVYEIFGSKENVSIIQNLNFDYEEMFLMSLCKHNIIANSSFSWWGAWLNQHEAKKVVAPKRWFANDAMQQLTHDLIPSNWIKI